MFAQLGPISSRHVRHLQQVFNRQISCERRMVKRPLLERALDRNLNPAQVECGRRNIQVYVDDKKDGYRKPDNVTVKQHVLDGFKQLGEELKMWKEEWKEKLTNDQILIYRPDETDVLWTFGKEEDRNKFIVSSDSDHNEGFSKSSLTESPAGYGLFSGTLDSKVPKLGKIKRAGYCNMTCVRAKRSFQREIWYDWSAYNKLVLRVRGDGRPYMLVIRSEGLFDITWNDYYHFILYTRGGPHWQLTKIPFSKFYLAAKARIQDKQCELQLTRVTHFGITAVGLDTQDGPFNLEIDYIGLELDPTHKEEFAYEMYQTPKYVVGSN